MSCFPCFRSKGDSSPREASPPPVGEVQDPAVMKRTMPVGAAAPAGYADDGDPGKINAKSFTFRDLATATKNFRQSQLLGEGGFGRVYKGTMKATGQVVAVKQLDRTMQEQKEFLAEVMTLSMIHHDNLIDLIGYCADGDQRLLVYEFVEGGALDELLYDFEAGKEPLDWFTRLKIAHGAAQGLEYLHEKVHPPVIYRDMKSANIMLDKDFNPKLSDFGMANLGPGGSDRMPPGSRVMTTYGYSAPETTRSGQVTLKSDVFSFGVVLLELITGRKAIDTTLPNDEQNLVQWAQPFFKDPKKFPQLADPLLKGRFPERSLNQTVAICAMCLQEEPGARPLISDVVMTLSFLSIPEPIPEPAPAPAHSSRSSSSDNDSLESTDLMSKYHRKPRKDSDTDSNSSYGGH